MQFFHIGIVVPQLEAARERLGEVLGVAWGPIGESVSPVRNADGRAQTVHFRTCFSTEPPYLELIEERPGTVWTCNEHSNIHHVAYSTDALVADSERLTAAGYALEVTRVGDEVPTTFAYHRDALGMRIELLEPWDANQLKMRTLSNGLPAISSD
jgi:glyoxalase/bleomycin resistance protein/dioxygenase superfamily protein